MAIKNIIFDLGGVLLDISFAKTKEAFIQSGVVNFEEYYQLSQSSSLFLDLEKGLVSPTEFYNRFRSSTGLPLSDETIRSNWNALLGKFRTASIEFLPQLKEKHKLFLFSNTNLIHYEAFIAIFIDQYGHDGFNNYFDKAYYSHSMNQRKPDPNAFLYITQENDLLPEETLFVDDSYANIQGAREAGLQTLWLKDGMLIEEAIPGFPGINL